MESAPTSCLSEQRMEVLSFPVGGRARRPSTRNRVELRGLSSMRCRSTGRSCSRAASSLATAATAGWATARSAAADVDETSSSATSGGFWASHCRHCARACGCEQTVRMAPGSVARLRRWWLISSESSPAISSSDSMRRSSVTLTDPSVEFSTGATPLHLVEDLRDAPRRNEGGGRAEAQDGRLVAEGGRRAQVGDGERMLEGQGGRENFPPDRLDPLDGEGAGVQAEQATNNLRFALGNKVREILTPLKLSDPEGGFCALVEEFEDLFVEIIDPGTKFVQVHKGS